MPIIPAISADLQYGVHLMNWKAVIIWVILVLILFVILLFALHFFIWIFWYPIQLKRWKHDFANAYDEEERQRLLVVRKNISKYWIPFYFMKKF